jgi:23S rRNA (guanosine2251-2'-O)-methyltransferase
MASTPVARVVNLGRALEQLRRAGFRVVGAASDARADLYAAEVGFPAVLVFGGEHRGIRPGVARRCEEWFRLPMLGRVSSLNVAVACGATCYELLRRHRAAEPSR